MNTEKLTAFINTLNGKEGTGSHLVTVPPGPSLADALLSSPILAGEGGSMMGLGASDFEFGVDPSADPELALVSKIYRCVWNASTNKYWLRYINLRDHVLIKQIIMIKQKLNQIFCLKKLNIDDTLIQKCVIDL